MVELMERKRELEENYRMLKTECEKAKADLDEHNKGIMVEWRKTNPLYWTIRCFATAYGCYVDFVFYRGCFSSKEKACAFLAEQKHKGQQLSRHSISYSILSCSTSELTHIPVFDLPCDLWYYEMD